MSEPFLAQISMFAGNFAPRGWAFCNGQLLPISQNTALFSLLGTTYGGDGRTTFALPDLRGRVPVNSGGDSSGPGLTHRPLGQRSGTEYNILSVAQMPSHNHQTSGSVSGTIRVGQTTSTNSPDGAYPSTLKADFGGEAVTSQGYSTTPSQQTMAADAVVINPASIQIGNTGGSQSVNNMQPYLAVNFIIATQGLFPSRN
mgnify:FL=1